MPDLLDAAADLLGRQVQADPQCGKHIGAAAF